jgi:hypothetical protein
VQHGEAQSPVPGLGIARLGLHDRAQQLVRVGEAPAAHRHRVVEPSIGDEAGDRTRRSHALGQRRVRHVVAAYADELWLVVGRVEEPVDRCVPEHGAQVAVEGAR